MDDKMDNIIGASVAALVGIIFVCSVVIPVAMDQIGSLTGDAMQYAPLLSVVIIIVIVGLVIGVIRFYQR